MLQFVSQLSQHFSFTSQLGQIYIFYMQLFKLYFIDRVSCTITLGVANRIFQDMPHQVILMRGRDLTSSMVSISFYNGTTSVLYLVMKKRN